jgi:hypothetical protein
MGAPGLAFETWDPSNQFLYLEVPKSVPQRLKPSNTQTFTARLKPCPSFDGIFLFPTWHPRQNYPSTPPSSPPHQDPPPDTSSPPRAYPPT